MSLQKNKRTGKESFHTVHLINLTSIFMMLCAVLFLSSCSRASEPLVIWTENAELASYVELFNTQNSDIQVVIQYKENPYGSLPPAKDEKQPDLLIGPSHRNNKVGQFLLPLDYLFKEQQLSRSDFYQPLTDMGFTTDKQYMLPISFNMPAVIFAANNAPLIPDAYALSLDEIRDAAASFNVQKSTGVYTKMGFAPLWNSDFLYTAAKLKGSDFQNTDYGLVWDKLALQDTVQYLKNWTLETNTSTTAETDYQFKYLNIPSLKWITGGESLFAYTTSSELFSKAPEKLQDIDYRWLQQDEQTPIEDTVVFISLYKDSRKKRDAETFILWLLNADNQKQILEWTRQLNYVSDSFGICGGFSSLNKVNDQFFPVFYPKLMGNLPQESELAVPAALPDRWESIKDQVIIPYLSDAANTTQEDSPSSLEELLAAWNKQYF